MFYKSKSVKSNINGAKRHLSVNNLFLYFCFIFSYKSAAEIYFSDKNHTESK